jgi:hypothetical protein
MSSRNFRGYVSTPNIGANNITFRGTRTLGTYDSLNTNKINAINVKTKNLFSQNIQTTAITTNITYSISNDEIVPNGTYTLNSNGQHNYIVVFNTINNSSGNINFTIDADISLASLGDKVTLMFKPSVVNGNQIQMTLSNDFYYTACGNVNTTQNLQNLERWVFNFTFDGEKYVCTKDIC